METKTRKCTTKDIAQIIEIGTETFKDTYSSDHTTADIAVYLQEHYTTDTIKEEIENPNCYYFFAEPAEGENTGFMKLTVKNEPSELNGKTGLQINRVYVKKEFKGQSIGKTLLNEAITLAGSLNLDCVWLCVWEHNLPALKFYEKLDFIKIGTTTFSFGSTTDTDYYMMLEL